MAGVEKNPETVTPTSLPGVWKIKRPVYPDERGSFAEICRRNELEEKLGREFNWQQSNKSRSRKGVLRGIHIAPWSKLVFVDVGTVQQVVVDFRKGSPTYGQHLSMILSEEDSTELFIPPYCGNAFLVLSNEDVRYIYQVDEYWSPGKEIGVMWNQPQLGIEWKISNPELSPKDKQNLTELPKLP